MKRLIPLLTLLLWCPASLADPLPNTQPLTWTDDIASRMIDGLDKFLLNQIEQSAARRARHWNRDFSSPNAYTKSLEPNRKALAHILGLRDARIPFDAPELIATTTRPALIAKTDIYEILAIRWPAFADVHGEGLLLSPLNRAPIASVIAIPDADVTPEQLVGLTPGVPEASQYARRLAESGCRVVVPALISRKTEKRYNRATLTHREFIYRPAFELGRHIIGYELQKILSLVDWFSMPESTRGSERTRDDPDQGSQPIGIIGWGEGGMLALYAAALDTRISATCVSGYFTNRNDVWKEPLDRNVFGFLDQFGDAELAAMIAPRELIVETAKAPELVLPGQGGAPGRLTAPTRETAQAELRRAQDLAPDMFHSNPRHFVGDAYCTDVTVRPVLASLSRGAKLLPPQPLPRPLCPLEDPKRREQRQVHELDRHTQWLLANCADTRATFTKKLQDAAKAVGSASADSPDRFAPYDKVAAEYREHFATEIIGRFDHPLLPMNPRSRLVYDTDHFTAHEVVLDVFDNVFAYGILLLPKDLKPDEKRPVVVCQHGLEGRPQHLITGDNPAYHDYAARLARRGFIVFAPQNPYIFGDRFRTLQRKANPLKKTLFSLIAPQHQQILNFLKSLPNVDEKRIAFYGLSYGGKTAMRVPALLEEYCLSICSADFNDWIWKNASTTSSYSYVWTGEYEIFEFDLGNTFNYAEMAALIAPRPFMVERGHFDGVASDERVASEFAKVRHLYNAQLKLPPEFAQIEFFVGPHTINGKGTFDFLHHHLRFPSRSRAKAP